MTYDLQAVIAELAAQFGIETGTLWDWLKSDGVTSYAKAYIAYNGTLCILCWTAAVFCVIGTIYGIRRVYDDVAFGLVFICALVEIPLALFILNTTANVIGWMASPEGMVIKQLVDALSQS